MKFFVASKNPVKINAVANAIKEFFPKSIVEGLEVESGVSAQPMSDEETKQGALNRAQAIRKLALQKKMIRSGEEVLYLGLEGGVFKPTFAKSDQELWSTVWAVAVDKNDQSYFSNGARFSVPEFLSKLLLAGEEMGPSLGKHLHDPDLRKKGGMIGFLTNNFTNRTNEYENIVKIAIGLWYKVYSKSSDQDCDLTKSNFLGKM